MKRKLLQSFLAFAAVAVMTAVPVAASDIATEQTTVVEGYRYQSATPDSYFTWSGDVITGFNGKVTSVVIPSRCVEIKSSAFKGKAITSIDMSASRITAINSCSFEDCTSLVSVTLPERLLTVGMHAFSNCKKLSSITIPSKVKSIGTHAFAGCTSLKTVDIKSTVLTAAGSGSCDYDCDYYSYLGAFTDCTSLSKITLPEGIKTVPKYFIGKQNLSSLTSFVIPSTVNTIGERAFEGSYIEKIVFPASVRTVGNYAFYGCKYLESVKLNDGLDSIGENAFENCDYLDNVVLPSSLTKLQSNSFKGCDSLSNLTIKSKALVARAPFVGCSYLSNITIEDGVTKITGRMFYGLTGLEKIVIPASVKYIGDYAFGGCKNISSVVIKGEEVEINNFAFYNTNKFFVISGIINSSVQKYAENHNYKFEALPLDRPAIKTINNVQSGVRLTWGRIAGADGYKIIKDGSVIGTVTGVDSLTYTDKKAVNGSNSTYKIYAYNSLGKSSTSVAKSIYFVDDVTAKAANSSDGIKVSWNSNATASAYRIYRSVDGGSYKLVYTTADGKELYYNDTKVYPCHKYEYKIQVVKKVSSKEYTSAFGAVADAYRVAPVSVTKLVNNGASVSVTWGKNSKASGYRIYRSINDGAYKIINTINGADTVTFADVNAKSNGSKYSYKVVAFYTVGDNTYNAVSGASKATYYVSKTAITSAVNTAASTIKVKWNAVSGATGYKIICKGSDGSEKTVTTDSSVSVKEITSLKKGVKYTFTVRAIKKVGTASYYSAASSAVSCTETK